MIDSSPSLGVHPSAPMDTAPMWETCPVELRVHLPRDVAAQVEEVAQSDPEFLSRVLLYGLTRRSIYRHLRDSSPDSGPLSDGNSTIV
jgi:hypothetical protein